MDSGLKQRLIGAAVLVALAVIFLPMLVKGPAPDSGVSDVPLATPDAPQSGEMQTRDLPLVAPDEAPASGATGMPAPTADNVARGDTLPTVDTAAPASQPQPLADAATAAPPEPMLPASAAGGDYAVHFGAYASSVSADTVVSRLRGAKLPAYRESAAIGGKEAWRVRIGPYATRADAETARIRANEVGRQSGARVVALDADAALPADAAAATASTAKPAAAPAQVETKPLPPAPAAPKPVAPVPKPSTPVATTPAAKPPVAIAPAPKPAAAGVGFAVQIGAFGSPAQANKKRDELRAAGFSAFTETVNSDKGALTRVLAGPVVARADADRLKAQIKAKTGTDGIVRPHP